MISLWKIIRTMSAIIGAVHLIFAVQTSDYYVMELGLAEPAYVKTHIIVGLLMLLPLLIHVLYDLYKEGKKNDVDR